MTKLGILNSQMKDFYDIWLLSRQFDFHGATLAKAIESTFTHRRTEISGAPVALTPAFAEDQVKQTQWRAFVRKSRIPDAPPELAGVVEALTRFLGPVASALASGKPFTMMWKAPGPWT